MPYTVREILAAVWQVLQFPLITLGQTSLNLASLLKFLILLVLVFALERVVRRQLLQRLLGHTSLSPAIQYSIARIFGYLVITLGIYAALQAIGIDLSSLAIVAGAIGLGIGFGLQNIINNFISGLILLAERPVSLGDRVEVSGVAGLVRKISLRSTTIVTNDNISIIVPNSLLISESVTNWSHGDPRVRIRIPFGVAYGTNTRKLEALMLEVAASHAAVLAEPAPAVFFSEFGDSSLNFEIAVWTSEMSASPRRFKSELLFAMEEKLRANGIEIPFPQRDIHVRGLNTKDEQLPAASSEVKPFK